MRRIAMLLGLAACGVPPDAYDAQDDADPRLEDIPAPYRFQSVDYCLDVVWERFDDGSVTFSICEGSADGFVVGMAETRSGGWGWYGEDCGPWGGVCQAFDSTTGVLAYVDEIDAVRIGETTLFDGGSDGMGDVIDDEGLDRLSFVLWFVGGMRDGQCVVWGDDPTYYADMGCPEI